MRRTTFVAACLALALSATAAQAQLAITNIEASHGCVGPARQSREYFQGDQVFFRYVVSGAQMDKAGDLNVEIALVLVDGAGNKVAGHLLVGDAYYHLQRYADAAREYKAALAIDPDNALARRGRELAEKAAANP